MKEKGIKKVKTEHPGEKIIKERFQLAYTQMITSGALAEMGAQWDAAAIEDKRQQTLNMYSLDPAQDIMESSGAMYPSDEEARKMSSSNREYYSMSWRREVGA